MAQKNVETQVIEQTQQLATLQIAVAKLVELPVTELAARVSDELLDNAALEVNDDASADDYADASLAPSDEAGDDASASGDATDDVDAYSQEPADDYGQENDAMSDYLTADDVPDYLQRRADAERDRNDFQYAATTSFFDTLQEQMGEYALTEHQRDVLTYLIGSLDPDGFLRKDLTQLVDEMELYHGVLTTPEELEAMLHILQRFEPKGIGARDLQECLRIQLEATDRPDDITQLALQVVNRHFKDFIMKHWDTLQARLHVDDDTFAAVIRQLTHLNPQPGSALADTVAMSAPTVVPDFFVLLDAEGEPTVQLNQGDVPDLRISPAFTASIKQYGGAKRTLSREQKDAYTYAKQKVEAAQSFINLIKRRNQTLLLVMQAIVRKQRAFFMNDDDESLLVPLNLKEIAEQTGVNISSVSRVTNSKYVATTYGTYPLKFFFSSQFTSAEGDELSARKVKAALRTLIEQEDKKHPLADERLSALLREQGFAVARRTVAKYRDMIGYPTARLRKV